MACMRGADGKHARGGWHACDGDKLRMVRHLEKHRYHTFQLPPILSLRGGMGYEGGWHEVRGRAAWAMMESGMGYEGGWYRL